MEHKKRKGEGGNQPLGTGTVEEEREVGRQRSRKAERAEQTVSKREKWEVGRAL